ncbi:MAG: polysaccharide deacetylase family protein [bacterium]|nr:polysaccharide deacetylase family protein [bacterium]
MRWRPTLAALAVLATVGALAVAMSSASVPTASASLDEPGGAGASEAPAVQPIAAAEEPEPPDGPDTVTAVVDEDLAEAAPRPEDPEEGDSTGEGDPPGEEDPEAAEAPDAADEAAGPEGSAAPDGAEPGSEGPALEDAVPTICPDPSDPFFNLYHVGENCYWLRFEEELQADLTEEELALVESVPFVAGYVAEPLGRPARTIRWGPPGEAGAPRFYLTFDDGPSTRWTRPTLDLLDRYGARATFFPVGAYAEVNFHIIEEIVARGHTIGSHLWSHERAALDSEDLFRRELRASAELYGELGTTCLRTPFGIVNDDILEWAGDEGFEVVLWGEPDPRDWEFPGIEKLTESMLGMQNGSILILHEHTGADTLAALDTVLEALDARGWRFDETICPLQF